MNLSFILPNQLVNDSQTQSGALTCRFGCKKWLEDGFTNSKRNPRAGISNDELALILGSHSCLQGNFPVSSHSLNRIHNQIDHNLMELFGATGYLGCVL